MDTFDVWPQPVCCCQAPHSPCFATSVLSGRTTAMICPSGEIAIALACPQPMCCCQVPQSVVLMYTAPHPVTSPTIPLGPRATACASPAAVCCCHVPHRPCLM